MTSYVEKLRPLIETKWLGYLIVLLGASLIFDFCVWRGSPIMIANFNAALYTESTALGVLGYLCGKKYRWDKKKLFGLFLIFLLLVYGEFILNTGSANLFGMSFIEKVTFVKIGVMSTFLGGFFFAGLAFGYYKTRPEVSQSLKEAY